MVASTRTRGEAMNTTHSGMTNERWRALMSDDSLELTADEIAAGWHFCCEMDGLLANSKEPDGDCFCSLSCRNTAKP